MKPAHFCARCAMRGDPPFTNHGTVTHIRALFIAAEGEDTSRAMREVIGEWLAEFAPLAVGALVAEAIRRSLVPS